MKRLCWGVFFILLSFQLSINQFSLDILPDWVGWIFFLKGLAEMAEESPLFEKLRPFGLIMAVYTAVLWIGGLLGITTGSVLGLLTQAAELFILWGLTEALRDVEERRCAALNGEQLRKLWVALAVLLAIGLLAILIPIVRVIWAVAELVCTVMFLVALWKSRRQYETLT